MATLKVLRARIKSVRSTKKITAAMKMVAASKFRRAQERVEAGRPYARHMALLLSRLSRNLGGVDHVPALMAGTGSEQKTYIVLLSSDRGLCGGFNTQLIRALTLRIKELEEAGRDIQIICVGRKGGEAVNRLWPAYHNKTFHDIGRSGITYEDAQLIANHILRLFENGQLDCCELLFNHFINSISSQSRGHQIIPVASEHIDLPEDQDDMLMYTYEPNAETVLDYLLPVNVITQLYSALMESGASEQGARMAAMDNATRSADDMIRNLNLTYNTTRQACITRELVEIISGAEAL